MMNHNNELIRDQIIGASTPARTVLTRHRVHGAGGERVTFAFPGIFQDVDVNCVKCSNVITASYTGVETLHHLMVKWSKMPGAPKLESFERELELCSRCVELAPMLASWREVLDDPELRAEFVMMARRLCVEPCHIGFMLAPGGQTHGTEDIVVSFLEVCDRLLREYRLPRSLFVKNRKFLYKKWLRREKLTRYDFTRKILSWERKNKYELEAQCRRRNGWSNPILDWILRRDVVRSQIKTEVVDKGAQAVRRLVKAVTRGAFSFEEVAGAAAAFTLDKLLSERADDNWKMTVQVLCVAVFNYMTNPHATGWELMHTLAALYTGPHSEKILLAFAGVRVLAKCFEQAKPDEVSAQVISLVQMASAKSYSEAPFIIGNEAPQVPPEQIIEAQSGEDKTNVVAQVIKIFTEQIFSVKLLKTIKDFGLCVLTIKTAVDAWHYIGAYLRYAWECLMEKRVADMFREPLTFYRAQVRDGLGRYAPSLLTSEDVPYVVAFLEGPVERFENFVRVTRSNVDFDLMRRIENLRLHMKYRTGRRFTRGRPVGMFFSGPSGAGKSPLVEEMIPRALFPYREVENIKELKYALPRFSDHWDGYTGQSYFVFEEFYTVNDESIRAKHSELLLNIMSSSTFTVPKADLDTKGTHFSSKYCMFTSNIFAELKDKPAITAKVLSALADPTAFASRFKGWYREDDGTLTPVSTMFYSWKDDGDLPNDKNLKFQSVNLSCVDGAYVFTRDDRRTWTFDQVVRMITVTELELRKGDERFDVDSRYRRMRKDELSRDFDPLPVVVGIKNFMTHIRLTKMREGWDRTELELALNQQMRILLAAAQPLGEESDLDRAYAMVPELIDSVDVLKGYPTRPGGERLIKFFEEGTAFVSPPGFDYQWLDGELNAQCRRRIKLHPMNARSLKDRHEAFMATLLTAGFNETLTPSIFAAAYAEYIAWLRQNGFNVSEMPRLDGIISFFFSADGEPIDFPAMVEALGRVDRTIKRQIQIGNDRRGDGTQAWSRSPFSTHLDATGRLAASLYFENPTLAWGAGVLLFVIGYYGTRFAIRKLVGWFNPQSPVVEATETATKLLEAQSAATFGSKTDKLPRKTVKGATTETPYIAVEAQGMALSGVVGANAVSLMVSDGQDALMCAGVAFSPDIIGTAAHSFRGLIDYITDPAAPKKNRGEWTVKLKRANDVEYERVLSAEDIVCLPLWDLVFFTRENFFGLSEKGNKLGLQPFKDLRSHMLTRKDAEIGFGQYTGAYRMNPNDKDQYSGVGFNAVLRYETYQYNVTSWGAGSEPNGLAVVSTQTVGIRGLPGSKGMSGCPYVAMGKKPVVLGLHVAGVSGEMNSFSSVSAVMPVTVETLGLVEGVFQRLEPQALGIPREWFDGTRCNQIREHGGNLPVATTVKFRRVLGDHELAEILGPNEFAPAPMLPVNGTSPVAKQLAKMRPTPPGVDADFMQLADEVYADIVDGPVVAPTVTECVVGIAGTVIPMDLNTSAGLCLVDGEYKTMGKKFDYVRKDGDTVVWSEHALIQKDVNDSLAAIERTMEGSDRERLVNYNQMMLKAEILPVEKVASAGTRIFSACSFAHLLICKMLFYPMVMLLRHAARDREGSSFPYGLNPYTEWELVERRFAWFALTFGGDVERFDKSMPPGVIAAAFHAMTLLFRTRVFPRFRGNSSMVTRAITSLYAFAGRTMPVLDPVAFWEAGIQCTSNEAQDPIFVLGPWEFHAPGVLSSGYWLTNALGCACMKLLQLHVFYRVVPGLRYRDHVKDSISGDDHKNSVSDAARAFNARSMKVELEKLGMGYTAADKSEVKDEFEECDFLKRTTAHVFVDGSRRTVGALGLKSLAKMVYWQEAGMTHDDLQQVTNAFSIEMVPHGHKAYEKAVHAVARVFNTRPLAYKDALLVYRESGGYAEVMGLGTDPFA